VKACAVERICNLVRKIVLSPAALSYWLPLQDLFAKLCCCPTDQTGSDLLKAARAPFDQAAAVLFPAPPDKQPQGAQS
jgi:hypothetical protein